MNYQMLIVTCLLVAIQLTSPVNADEECCEEYCYGSDRERPQTRQYSTKTAYEVIRGIDYGKLYQAFNCQATKIWIFSRHGTRNPTPKDIKSMQQLEALRNEIMENYDQRKYGPTTGSLCRADKSMLKMWKLNKNITDISANTLTFQGWQDMKFLAKSYQKHFENVLEKQYDPTKFLFRHTSSQRTEASFKAFAEGLFGENAGDKINLPKPLENDKLLMPYENCPEWQQQNDMKFGPDTEVYKFENSQIMNKTLFDISRRLGFKYILQREQIDSIWDMCRYEQAWHVDRSSAWCAAFTPNLVSVLEYAEDLKYYHKAGYGSELNSKVACAAVKDMLNHLNSTAQPQAVAYFTHSAAIQLLITALGLSKDRQTLRADNYMEMKDRLWKTSTLSPFAANLVAVKYSCINDPRGDEAKVMFYINQMAVKLDWCNIGLCNWGDVMINYEKFLNANCDEYFCNNYGSSSSQNQLSFSLMLTLIIYIFCISLTKKFSI